MLFMLDCGWWRMVVLRCIVSSVNQALTSRMLMIYFVMEHTGELHDARTYMRYKLTFITMY